MHPIRLGAEQMYFDTTRLQNAKPTRTGYLCSCPCAWNHSNGDEHPSLSITLEGGQLLAKCFRNCNFKDIVREFKRTGVLLPAENNIKPSHPGVAEKAPQARRDDEEKSVPPEELARYDAGQMREHARVYWQAQLNALPCAFGAKNPKGCWKQNQRERYSASRLRDEIKKPCNLSVVCGKTWNLTIIDIDNPSLFAERVLHTWGYTLKSFLRLCAREGAHIERTGKGFHLFFAYSQLPDALLKRKCTLDNGGFEILSKESESCVVAPSYHSSKKKFYRAVTPIERLKERKPIPQEVVEMLTSTIERSAPTQESEDGWHAAIPFFSLLNLPPAPLSALPPIVGDFVKEVSACVQVDPDLPLGFALATVSAACVGGWRVHVNNTWDEELAIYTAIIAESGEHKTPVYKLATEPLYSWQEAYRKEQAKELHQLAELRKAWEKRKEKLHEQLAKLSVLTQKEERDALMQEIEALNNQEPAEPGTPFAFIASNATVEALSVLLSQNFGIAALLSDEPDLFSVLSTKYQNVGTASQNCEPLFKGYDGTTFDTARITRKRVTVQRPVIALGIATQPEVLKNLFSDPLLQNNGFSARFVFCWCRSLAGTRTFKQKDFDERVLRRWRELIISLSQKRIELLKAGRYETLALSPSAYERFGHFFDEVEIMLREGGRLSAQKEWGKKYRGRALRLAALFHLAKGEEGNLISLPTLEEAIEVSRWTLEHALYTLQETGLDDTAKHAKKMAERILTGRLASFTMRDVETWLRLTAGEAEEVLTFLSRFGWIKRLEREPGKVGRPSERYAVNPAIWGTNRPESISKISKIPPEDPSPPNFADFAEADQPFPTPFSSAQAEEQPAQRDHANSTTAAVVVKQYETNSGDDEDPQPSPPSGVTPEEAAKLDHLACVLKKTIQERGELRITPSTPGYAQVAHYLDELKSRVLPEFTLIQEQDRIVARRALSEDDINFIAKSKALWSAPHLLAEVLKTDVRAVNAAIEHLEAKNG